MQGNRIVIHKPGGFDQLKYESFTPREPADGEVLVETHAVGVNYADVCVRWGVYASAKEYVGWPITPGFEFSGRVLKSASPLWKPGNEIFGITRFDGYASHVTTRGDLCWKIPKSMSADQAAAFPAVSMTAFHALLQMAYVREGFKVLVHSAGGGVGTALVQIAKIKKMEVTGVVGSAHKVAHFKALGADHVIDKSAQDLWRECERICPGGYDLVFDANGPSTLRASYDHLRPTGKVISYGFHSMLPKDSGRIDYLKVIAGYLRMPYFNTRNMTNENKSVMAFNLSFLFSRHDLLNEAMPQLLEWTDTGRLRPPVVEAFALRDAAKAHAAIQSGETVGKLVLKP